MKKILGWLGTLVFFLVLGACGFLVWFNVLGQGKYGATCKYSLGCRSFYCLLHGARGSAQVTSEGTCTKKCDATADCGSGFECVKLDDASLDDLPPLGKPERACMRVLPPLAP